jgi:hypothetical protein
MRISLLALAGLISIGVLTYPLSQSAYAHSFSGSESASFLALVHKIRVESQLAADNASNATFAREHAEAAAELLDDNTLEEISERNERIANELTSLLQELQNATSFAQIDPQSMIRIASDLDATLGEAVSVRIEQEQITNSTVQAVVLADIIDEILRNYGDAFEVGFDMTDMSLMDEMDNGEHEMEANETSTHKDSDAKVTVYRDSRFVDLSGKELAANDFIHLYDSTPYMIMNGHVAAKLPCDDQAVSPIQILIGQAPNLTETELDLVSELSAPGNLCLYHADLESSHNAHDEDRIVTDVAISNPTDSPVTFSNTSGVVIGVNEIMEISDEGNVGGSTVANMTAYQSAHGYAVKALEIFQSDLEPLPTNQSSADAVSRVKSSLLELHGAVESKANPMEVMNIVHGQIHPNMQIAYNLQIVPEFPLSVLVLIPAIVGLLAVSRIRRSG